MNENSCSCGQAFECLGSPSEIPNVNECHVNLQLTGNARTIRKVVATRQHWYTCGHGLWSRKVQQYQSGGGHLADGKIQVTAKDNGVPDTVLAGVRS